MDLQDPTRPTKLGPAWRRVRRVALVLLIAGALVHPISGWLARWDWRADLISHFQEPALALTILAGLATFRRHRRIAAALAILAAFQVVPLIRYSGWNPVLPDPRSPARLRILMANVLVDNADHISLARLIRRERPDVVGLVEITPDWLADLADLRREYPYRVEVIDPGHRGAKGLALWFRARPILVDGPERPSPDGWPFLHAVIRFDGLPRHLWLVHPSSPFRRWDAHVGHPELDALARRVGASLGSKIVVGDLNSTDGSPHFADFLRVAGLRDSRLGFGRQPSWHSRYPYRISIDHAFLTDDLAVVDRRLGPRIGSDHFPLIVEIAPASAPNSTTNEAAQPSHSLP